MPDGGGGGSTMGGFPSFGSISGAPSFSGGDAGPSQAQADAGQSVKAGGLFSPFYFGGSGGGATGFIAVLGLVFLLWKFLSK